jgi:hypothetical protein
MEKALKVTNANSAFKCGVTGYMSSHPLNIEFFTPELKKCGATALGRLVGCRALMVEAHAEADSQRLCRSLAARLSGWPH